jgi:hypothetical protein
VEAVPKLQAPPEYLENSRSEYDPLNVHGENPPGSPGVYGLGSEATTLIVMELQALLDAALTLVDAVSV